MKRNIKQIEKEIPWNLIITKLEQSITDYDDRRLTEWLSCNENRLVYNDICSVWNSVQERESEYRPDSDYYWKIVAQKLNLSSVRKKQKQIPLIHFMGKYKIAVSITLFIAFSVSLYFGSKGSREDISEQKYININGKSQILLPDGSIVWLGSNTTLAYKTDFKKNNRVITLEGEAFFEVSKAKQQFIVHTDKLDIVVHGTKFNVSSLPDKEEIYVSLLKGSVSLNSDAIPKEQILLPGEKAIYNKKNHQVSILKNEAEMDAAWTIPTIHFSQKTLADICAVLSKRYDVEINVNPDVANKYTYTFTLHEDETIDEILELMASTSPIKYAYLKNKIINIK
jgi:ferric-dicitrate binding protein FerR (iron transport regulator)